MPYFNPTGFVAFTVGVFTKMFIVVSFTSVPLVATALRIWFPAAVKR